MTARPLSVTGFVWIALAIVFAESASPGQVSAPLPAPKTENIKAAVDQIGRIQGLPPKEGERQTDPYAVAIVAFGKAAGPFLVERIIDRSPSQVVYGFRYSIGDLALVLLRAIYRPPSWPFPDRSFQIPERYGDFRDYAAFMNSAKQRERLKQSWKRYVRLQGSSAG